MFLLAAAFDKALEYFQVTCIMLRQVKNKSDYILQTFHLKTKCFKENK